MRYRGAPRLCRGVSERWGAWGALRGPPSQSVFDEGAEVAPAQRVAKLPERLRFDLPDTLARHVEPLADFFESVLALLADAEPQTQNLLFLRRKHRQCPLNLRAEVLVEQRLVGRAGRFVLEEIAQLGVLSDRRLQRERLARRLEDEPDLLRRHPGALGELLGGRLAPDLVDQIAIHARDPVQRLDHM